MLRNCTPLPGSIIQVREDYEGAAFSWKSAPGGCARFASAAFLGFWLCGWAAGEVFAIGALAGMIGKGAAHKGAGLGGNLFLLGWLGAWTVGGLVAGFAFFQLIRPPRPESVTLGRDRFRYDPGTVMMAQQEDSGGQSGVRGRQGRSGWRTWGKVVEAAKLDMQPAVLERVGERQRLVVDIGAQRVEIGRGLSEPEREWLAAAILNWQAT